MLNAGMGTQREVRGRRSIETYIGAAGHAVYGPYERLAPGRYAVEFHLALTEGQDVDQDVVCATIDVAIDSGSTVLRSREITSGELSPELRSFQLTFELTSSKLVEYRVDVNGVLSLRVDEHRSVVDLPDNVFPNEAMFIAKRFPVVDESGPEFLRSHEEGLRRYHERGIDVRVEQGDVILRTRGVSFYARCWDDLNFINEVFFESAYGFKTGADACVIDVGMNIGLASLLLATNPRVKEVHSFEPFPETYQRAIANLSLNPALATKITPYNIGLSDRDDEAAIVVPETGGDSGCASVLGVSRGRSVHLVLRDAAATLRPIIARAKAAGQDVIVKIDCEGSEFAIFRTLQNENIFEEVTALMVEWHRIFDDKSEKDLIDPLESAGFTIFDLTPKTGNGFFYAARTRFPAKLAA